MTRNVLLDTNLLIAAFDSQGSTSPEMKRLAIRQLSELSANLFRFDSWLALQANDRNRNVDKRKFDVFHFCSAHCNSLEFCSNDTDIGRIRTLHNAYEEALAS